LAGGGAEVLKTSGADGATSIPVAGTPLRLSHTAGAIVQTATLVPLGPPDVSAFPRRVRSAVSVTWDLPGSPPLLVRRGSLI